MDNPWHRLLPHLHPLAHVAGGVGGPLVAVIMWLDCKVRKEAAKAVESAAKAKEYVQKQITKKSDYVGWPRPPPHRPYTTAPHSYTYINLTVIKLTTLKGFLSQEHPQAEGCHQRGRVSRVG